MKGVRTPKANPRLVDSALVSDVTSSFYPTRLDIRSTRSPLSYSRPVIARITSPENSHHRSHTDSDYLGRQRASSGIRSPEPTVGNNYQLVGTDTGNLFLAEINRLESIITENRKAEEVWKQKEKDMGNRITLLIAENERLSGLVDQYAAEADRWKTKYSLLTEDPENNLAILLQQRQSLEYEVDRLNEAVAQRKRELNMLSNNRFEDLIASGNQSVRPSAREKKIETFDGMLEGEKRQIEEIEKRALRAVEGQGKEIEILKSAYSQLKLRFAEVSSENERLKAISPLGNKENEVPNAKKLELQIAENERLKRSLETLQVRLVELENASTQVRERVHILSNENTILKEHKRSNSRGIQIPSRESDPEKDMLKERIKELEVIVKSTLGLKDKIMLLADQNQFLTSEVEAKELQIKELDLKILENERYIKQSADLEKRTELVNGEKENIKKLLLEKEGEAALWKMKAGQFEEQIVTLKLEVEVYKEDLKGLQKNLYEIQAQKDSLNELYSKNQRELKEANNHSTLDHSRLVSEKEELKSRLNQSALELESMKTKAKQHADQLASLQEKNRELQGAETSNKILQSENLQLKNSLRDNDLREQELRNKVRDLDIDRLKLQEEVKNLERKLSTVEFENKSLQEALASQKRQLESLNNSLILEQRKTQEHVSFQGQEHQNLRSKLEGLIKENEYLNMKNNAQKTEQAEKSELQAKIKLLMADNERLKIIIESKEVYKAKSDELQSQCDSLREENARLMKEAGLQGILKSERDEYQEKIQLLSGERAQLEAKIRSLDLVRAEKQSLEQRVEQLIFENTALQKNLISKNEEILQRNDLYDKISILVSENLTLNNFVAEKKRANDELQKALDQQRVQFEDLKREYLEAEAQKHHLSNQKDSLARLNQDLEERLRLKDQESREMTQTLQSSLKTTNELQVKLRVDSETLKLNEKELSNEIMLLNSQIKKMSAEEKRLNDLIQDQRKQVDDWEKECLRLKAENNALQGSYHTVEVLTQEQEKLLGNFEQKILENENLRERIRNLEKELTSSSALKENIAVLTQENKELQELVENYQDEILQLKIKEGDVEKEKMNHEHFRKNIEKLAEEKENLRAKGYEQEAEMRNWKNKYETLTQENQDLEQRIGTLIKENTYLNNSNSQKLAEIDRSKKDVEELRLKVTLLEEKLNLTSSEKQKLEYILENTNQELIQTRQSSNVSADLTTKIQQLTNTVEIMKAEINVWKDRCNQAEKAQGKLGALENKLNELIYENERLNQLIASKTKDYREKEQAVLDLKNQVAQLQNEKSNISELNLRQSEEIYQLKAKNTVLEQTKVVEGPKTVSAEQEKEKRNMLHELQENNKLVSGLKSQIEASRNENERLERQVSNLVVELQALKAAAKDQQSSKSSHIIHATSMSIPTNRNNELAQILGESSRHIENLNQELERRSTHRQNLRESQFRLNEARSDVVKSTIYNNFEELNSELEGGEEDEEDTMNEPELNLEELEEEDKIGLLVEEIEKLNTRLAQKNRVIEECKNKMRSLEELLRQSEDNQNFLLEDLTSENQKLKLVIQSQEKELEVLKVQANVTFERSYRESLDENEYEDELAKKVIALNSEVTRLNQLLAEKSNADSEQRIKAFAPKDKDYVAILEQRIQDLSLNNARELDAQEMLKVRIVLMCAEIERLTTELNILKSRM